MSNSNFLQKFIRQVNKIPTHNTNEVALIKISNSSPSFNFYTFFVWFGGNNYFQASDGLNILINIGDALGK